MSERNGRRPHLPSSPWDVVVVGSGFGGTMAAYPLVKAGLRVLMLERGDWVPRGPHNQDWSMQWNDRPEYSLETPYRLEGHGPPELGAFHCVGGPSVFYGGVALRFREEDFRGAPDIAPGVRWPIGYADLAPWYDRAERLLGVSGDTSDDPTAPPRSRPLPPTPMALSATSRGLDEAARRLGLRPFRLPLALNVDGERGASRCTGCGVCDGYACAIGAKNDLATAVLPSLVEEGLTLRPNTVAVSLEREGDRVVAAVCVDRVSGERLRFEGERFVVAAGALATPHLLLTSGLEQMNPAGDQVGRNLMRHCNGIVLGASPSTMGEADEFRKQIGLHDFYFGDARDERLAGKLGAIQQVRATQIAISMARLPRPVKRSIYPFVERMVGFIVIAEDQPRPENRVLLDPVRRDRFGRPEARIEHRYTRRDQLARTVLCDRAREILREAGSAFTMRVNVPTFSHGVGTVRMGDDPARFPVAPDGRYRGVPNLFVTDGSVFPTSGAVNPSLSISANALRVASAMARSDADRDTDVGARARVSRAPLPVVERREA